MRYNFTIITTIIVLFSTALFSLADEPEYGIAEADILDNPAPDVDTLTINDNLLHDRWYMQVNGTVNVYDAPNGKVVRVIDEGFNFVTSLEEQDGWIQINSDEWVQSSDVVSSNGIISQFTGAMLPEDGLPYPIGWSLVNQYPSREPGENPVESNGMTWRYTLLYLYDEVEVDGYIWYQIGVDKWIHQFNVAQVKPVERPDDVDTDIWVSIDLYEQVLIAYEDETPIMATLIATGMDRFPTREGVYHIYFRRTRKDMSGGQVGDDYYYLEEVPWTMFFDEGRALHGAYWHDGFGFRRSHGCVNLSITDSHWLYQWVADYMGKNSSADVEDGPAVWVYASGEYE